MAVLRAICTPIDRRLLSAIDVMAKPFQLVIVSVRVPVLTGDPQWKQIVDFLGRVESSKVADRQAADVTVIASGPVGRHVECHRGDLFHPLPIAGRFARQMLRLLLRHDRPAGRQALRNRAGRQPDETARLSGKADEFPIKRLHRLGSDLRGCLSKGGLKRRGRGNHNPIRALGQILLSPGGGCHSGATQLC